MIAMSSRVRSSGLPNGTPCQTSTTYGPDGPMPHRKRLPDIACKVIAVIAVQAGVPACFVVAEAKVNRAHERPRCSADYGWIRKDQAMALVAGWSRSA
jgi:hypothetical protein